MSKKTDHIYREIEALEDLQNQISIINSLAKAKGESGEESHHLEEIEFKMSQSIKSLRFWIGSLYATNGKSTSRAKVNASKENGKKGGRPPKEITLLRHRKSELEEVLIPELRRELVLTTDFNREEQINLQIKEYEGELTTIEEKLNEWGHKKTSALFAE